MQNNSDILTKEIMKITQLDLFLNYSPRKNDLTPIDIFSSFARVYKENN